MQASKLVDPATWPRSVKKAIVFAVDVTLVPVSLYVAYALRLNTIEPHTYGQVSLLYFALVSAAGVPIIRLLRLNRLKLHAFDMHAIGRIALSSAALILAAVLISYVADLWAPRSVPFIFGVVFFTMAVFARLAGLLLFDLMHRLTGRSHTPVAIYGAGAAGLQLATALRQSREMRPVAFVDDNPALHGIIVGGTRVFSPDKLEELAASGRIERVLIAIPSLSTSQRETLKRRLDTLPCLVQTIPSYIDLIAGRNWVDDLKAISPDQLLDRANVDLDIPEVAKAYAGRCVMVTGAGGSIGSELCRQLVDCDPRRIVLFERSELALYEIERTLLPLAKERGIEIATCLGSVIDRPTVDAVIERDDVDIIVHAAAYKHVPLIEGNELEGVRNNVIGTRVVAEAARLAGIERFILVSTDKAVRPTNVMGATKRLAEIVAHDAQRNSSGTRFAMVRFGNVLGSSGSVVPLFHEQIRRGGPVTVTHPEVTRYFMTIPEAARLVLLAGAYSEGDDLFVLDMGAPVKIVELARRMIKLANMTVRDADNPGGDIEIVFCGLRPGEKLYEELLIDDDSLIQTPHEKILRASEAGLSEIEVAAMLKQVGEALDKRDTHTVRKILQRYVTGYGAVSSTATG
ncbi:MAG: nucleoside-diphosphate sugar epimerase/dehydratase [Roseitalea porphyridii]|uniref:polysaccharide biosynthesis protein n=1 Tax=Roseitalea porphyridii TaxID=1852022 RepID=UPI0032D94535